MTENLATLIRNCGPIRRVGVIGMGYVGIPAAALFADVPGIEHVYGFQRYSASSGYKIAMVNRGESPSGRGTGISGSARQGRRCGDALLDLVEVPAGRGQCVVEDALKEGYQDDRGKDHPGARSYETNRDVKWICRILQQMEARDEEFEGRLRALEGWRAGEERRLSAIGAGAGGIVGGVAEG